MHILCAYTDQKLAQQGPKNSKSVLSVLPTFRISGYFVVLLGGKSAAVTFVFVPKPQALKLPQDVIMSMTMRMMIMMMVMAKGKKVCSRCKMSKIFGEESKSSG